MKILVCISHVPDTETKIRITADRNSVDKTEIQWVINPWDELGLTRAVQLKDDNSQLIESITVITVGGPESTPALRKALALGADHVIRIDSNPPDSWFVARQISEIIKNNYYDMVITGIESSDFNGYAVGGMLAELTGYAFIPNVSSLEIENNKIIAFREVEGGNEKLEAEVPFIAVIQKGVASAPGIPSMRGIMKASGKPVEVIQPVESEHFLEYSGYDIPSERKECKLISIAEYHELIDRIHTESGII